MKNLKSVIMNVAVVLLGVLALVFMSQAYYTISMAGQSESATGFDFLESAKDAPSDYTLVQVSVIIGIVVLSIMMLVAIVNLLANLGVIKSEKVAKILKFVNVAAAVLFVVFAVCALVGVANLVADTNAFVKMASIGWACIANLVVAVVTAVATVLDLVVKNKK